MAWTDHTWVTGETITATLLNGLRDNDRFLHDQGADIPSASTIAPLVGLHTVTGATQINNITQPSGAGPMKLTLRFTGTPLLKNLNGGAGQINLRNGGDRSMAVGEVIELQYDATGQIWYELGPRTPIFVGCQAYRDTAQTIATATATAIALNMEDYDYGGFHDPASNNSRMTIPGSGLYAIQFYVPWTGSVDDNASVKVKWVSGGVTKYLQYYGSYGTINGNTQADIESIKVICAGFIPAWQFTTGDYVELIAEQRQVGSCDISGRAIAANPALGVMFTIWRVG